MIIHTDSDGMILKMAMSRQVKTIISLKTEPIQGLRQLQTTNLGVANNPQ